MKHYQKIPFWCWADLLDRNCWRWCWRLPCQDCCRHPEGYLAAKTTTEKRNQIKTLNCTRKHIVVIWCLHQPKIHWLKSKFAFPSSILLFKNMNLNKLCKKHWCALTEGKSCHFIIQSKCSAIILDVNTLLHPNWITELFILFTQWGRKNNLQTNESL